MSFQSQEANMRRLAELLSHDISYIWGERECGPNGDKKTFLNVGKTFLRALGKDLGLRDVKVVSNAGGIAVSGECTLIGMWEDSGIYMHAGLVPGAQLCEVMLTMKQQNSVAFYVLDSFKLVNAMPQAA